uniref:Uncharacterized protein n=1 Tax=Monodon monoceros TaxID=40151 RepID=A0A8C6B7U6_MONMO
MRPKDQQGHVCQAKGFEVYSAEYGLPWKNFKQVTDVNRIASWKNLTLACGGSMWGEGEWRQGNQLGSNWLGTS